MNFLNRLFSNVKLPEATFNVQVEQQSLNRLAATVIVTTFLILLMVAAFKKINKNANG
jgi:hypothetical protein